MKGVLNPDHIPLNNYELRVATLPPLLFTTIGGIEEELEAVDLPDRTVASGGHTKAIEFAATLPLHHVLQVRAMERWYKDSQDPVSPLYKKIGTLMVKSISGFNIKMFLLPGLFPCKYKTGDLDMNNEGELHVVEWTFKADRVEPL